MRDRFVFDGQEVEKTGRIASRDKQVRSYDRTRTVTETVCEITPIVRPGELAWKRWVREDDLFVINDTSSDDPLPEFPVDLLANPINPKEDGNQIDDILNQLRGKSNNGLS